MMEYASPGAAFSGVLEQSLMARERAEQDRIHTQLAIDRENRQAMRDQVEAEQAKAALAEKRQMFDEAQKDKRKAAFEKTVTSMVPGDIPSPQMLEQAHEFGLSHLFPADTNAVIDSMPVPASLAADPATAAGGIVPQPTPATPLPQKFIGTPAQRKDATENAALDAFTASLPEGSPERQALQYERLTNHPAPAGMFKGKSDDGTAVARVDPKRQIVQRLIDGQWTDVVGDVPKGTHFIQQPDNSAREAAGVARDAAREEREGRDVQGVREHGYTEFNKLVGDAESQLKEFEKVGTALNQRTAQADAELSVMFLKAVAGGYGSGLRMTKTEIDNTLHGSTKWENLERTLNAWSSTPQTAPIPDEQRAAMRSLAQALRDKAHKLADKVNKARIGLDSAKSMDDANKVRTQLRVDMNPEESELSNNPAALPTTGTDGKKVSAKDWLANYRGKK